MTEWVKYDGTNKPDDGALVRVKLHGFRDMEARGYVLAEYLVWSHDPTYRGSISHFMLKPDD